MHRTNCTTVEKRGEKGKKSSLLSKKQEKYFCFHHIKAHMYKSGYKRERERGINHWHRTEVILTIERRTDISFLWIKETQRKKKEDWNMRP